MKEVTYQETAFIDFAELRREFLELLDALKIKRLFILIDEWSAIDKKSRSLCQIYFAEYLKRAFFGTSRICLKISAIEHESIFSETINDRRIGLEVEADVFAQVNLDQIYDNRVLNLSKFFLELIYRRLKYCEVKIAKFASRRDPDTPVQEFLEMIFESNEFDELIRASGGIPRDFINTFDAVAAYYDFKVEKKWKRHRIQEVIMQRAINNTDHLIKERSVINCIFQEIRNVIAISHKRNVLVPKNLEIEISEAVEYLFANRIIHKINIANVPEKIRSEYFVFNIDYGVFLDWTREFDIHEEIEGTEAALDDVEIYRQIVNIDSCRLRINQGNKKAGLFD